MSNIAATLQKPEAIVRRATEQLLEQLKKGQGPEFAAHADFYIKQAGHHLTDALKRSPGTPISDEAASQALLSIGQELMNAHKAGSSFVPAPAAIDDMVKKAVDATAKKSGMLAKLSSTIAKNKVGALILKHPEKAAGVAGLLTLMAAWLLPNRQEQTKAEDGSVEASEKWSAMKVTAVALGSILSAGLLAHFAHGQWANKAKAVAEKTLTTRG